MHKDLVSTVRVVSARTNNLRRKEVKYENTFGKSNVFFPKRLVVCVTSPREVQSILKKKYPVSKRGKDVAKLGKE